MQRAVGAVFLGSRKVKCRCSEKGKNLACLRNGMIWKQGEQYGLCGPHRIADNNNGNCCGVLGPPFCYINLHGCPLYRPQSWGTGTLKSQVSHVTPRFKPQWMTQNPCLSSEWGEPLGPCEGVSVLPNSPCPLMPTSPIRTIFVNYVPLPPLPPAPTVAVSAQPGTAAGGGLCCLCGLAPALNEGSYGMA